MKNIFKYLILLLINATVLLPVSAQEGNVDDRKTRKTERHKKAQADLDEMYRWARDSALVIEADLLYDRYGRSVVVVANNFVAIEGEKVVLQTADPSQIGRNGLGGVTLEGRVLDYEMTRTDNSINLIVQVSTTVLGHGTINISLMGRHHARATYTGSWGSKITFSGDVYHPSESHVYQGIRTM